MEWNLPLQFMPCFLVQSWEPNIPHTVHLYPNSLNMFDYWGGGEVDCAQSQPTDFLQYHPMFLQKARKGEKSVAF